LFASLNVTTPSALLTVARTRAVTTVKSRADWSSPKGAEVQTFPTIAGCGVAGNVPLGEYTTWSMESEQAEI
jgi:hypothetical protein